MSLRCGGRTQWGAPAPRNEGGRRKVRECIICGKRPSKGHKVSHSGRRTKRWFYPNLQKLRIVWGGRVITAYVCTKCLKAGKVKRPA